MLLLILDAFDPSLPKKLEAFGEVSTDSSRLSEADVVLVRSKTLCDKQFIDSATNVKLILRGGVGIDNIDAEYAKSKGIYVLNTPKSSAVAVAELAFALMISVPTRLIEVHNGMKNGQWLKNTKRTELYGKTLALLGMGNIASKLAERARAFGMKVVAYDKYVASSLVAKLVPTLEDAVREADYISLHLPLTSETSFLFCDSLINACKRSPVVINTGRGNCIDPQAMSKALEDGRISWYAADVYPTDPPDADYPLLASDRVTLTPHIGASSEENLLRIGDEAFHIIQEMIAGGVL
jgi:phosphoglycerate dehydrogenase-like enzyme